MASVPSSSTMYAITGMAVRFPKSNSLGEFWDNLINMRECTSWAENDRWNSDFYTHPDKERPGKMITSKCGFVDHVFDFDNEAFGISKKEAQFMDPQQKMLLEVTKQALDDAGFKYQSSKTGVFVGIGQEEHSTVSTFDKEAIGPYHVTGASLSIAANRISFVFDFRGPSLSVDTACSSSATAFHFACMALAANQCDQAVVAGVNIVIDPAVMIEFSKLGVLSPHGRCKSFDKDADGYVRAEGCGVVVIKPYSSALRDGDQIYALVSGSAVNSDGRGSPSLTMPCGEAQKIVFRDALRQSAVDTKSVFWAEAHATGTKVGDPIEANALGSIFGGKARSTPLRLGAVKPNLGHLECASFMASLIKVALMIEKKTLVPTINFSSPNPDIKFDDHNMTVQTTAEQFDPTEKAFVISSFGFGGSNACVVLQGKPHQSTKINDSIINSQQFLYVLSAETVQAVETQSLALIESFKTVRTESKKEAREIARDIAGTLLRRQSLRYLSYGIGNENIDKIKFTEPKQTRSTKIPLVWVFPGQGPQHHNMGRQLFATYKVFRNTIKKCDDVYRNVSGKSLLEDYGLFTEFPKKDADPQAIHNLSLTLPSLVFLHIALIDLWKSFGVIPDAVVGHSFGEMAATYCAGVVSLEQIIEVAYHRSKLLEAVDGKGGMIAVGCGAEKISEFLSERMTMKKTEDLWIAAYNASDAVTCGGTIEAVQDLSKKLTDAKIFNRILKINSAYHTPIMMPVREKALDLFGKCMVSTKPPSIPFMSTVTKTWQEGLFPSDYMWLNIERPVFFMSAVQGIVERFGTDTLFMEMSAHPVLNTYIKQTVQAANTCFSLHRDQSELSTIYNSVVTLISNGHSVDPRFILGDFTPLPMNALPYPFTRLRSYKEAQDQFIERTRPIGSFHELAGKKIPIPEMEVWSENLAAPIIPWVNDHVVQSAVVFPAAAYVEMMFEVLGTSSVSDIKVDRVMNFIGNDSRSVRTVVAPGKNCKVARIYSKMDSWATNENWILHAEGHESNSEFESKCNELMHWAGDIVKIARQWKSQEPLNVQIKNFNQKEIYDRFKFMDLLYGPNFQGIQSLSQIIRDGKSDEGFAFIEMNHLKDLKYILHPAILDVSFQCILGVNRSLASAFVPTFIKKISWSKNSSQKKFLAVARCSSKDDGCIGDVVLFDEEGNMIGFVNELSATALVPADAGRLFQKSYDVKWQPWEFPSLNLEFPEQLVIPKINDFIGHDLILSQLCSNYIRKTLQSLPQTFFNEKRPIHRQKYLNWCQSVAQTCYATDVSVSEAMKTDFSTEIEAVQRVGENLTELLKDPLAAQKILFSDDLPERLYKKSATFFPFVEHMADIFADVILKTGERVIRVLEVGAGTGGLTLKLLQRLKEKQKQKGQDLPLIKYIFTDVSQKFLKDAQKLLEEYSFIEYKLFNLERSCEEQNITKHSVDIVLAFDVMHVASDITLCLKNISNVLAPNGLLLAIEPTRPSVWMNMFFGLFKEWWDFKDEAVRKAHCTMSPSHWIEVLESNSFLDVLVINNETKLHGKANSNNLSNNEFVHSVIVAHNLSLPGIEENGNASGKLIEYDATQNSLEELLSLSQKEFCKSQTPCTLLLITEAAQPVLATEMELNPKQAQFIGFARVLGNEYSLHKIRMLDLPAKISESDKKRWINNYKYLLEKNLLVHTEVAVRDGKWWLPHLKLIEQSQNDYNHMQITTNNTKRYRFSIGTPGQLATMKFVEFSEPILGASDIEVKVFAAALNFKDVMLGLGMIKLKSKNSYGLEFSGIVSRIGENVKKFAVGDEVFGVGSDCFANHVVVAQDFVVKKPAFLSHVEAASIPITFSTCYAGLVSKANLSKDDVVLVHSAAGGIGQSCIQLCNHFGAEVIATVGSEEKRTFLHEKYKVTKFSDSRNHATWFSDVKNFTKGKGVDIVVNSLKGPAIEQGIKSLALGGRFIEIGKVDILDNHSIGLAPFLNDLSFLSVQLDMVMDKSPHLMNKYLTAVANLVESRAINPIVDKVYESGNIEQAFRYMMSGQHKGKIVIDFTNFDPKSNSPVIDSHSLTENRNLAVVPLIFKPECLYVLSGGLGALGWNIVKWMVKLGARKFLVLSRTGELSLSQKQDLKEMNDNDSVQLVACRADVSKAEDIKAAYRKAKEENIWTGKVAIQHLVMVLKDSPIIDMTWSSMDTVLKGKVDGAENIINCLPENTNIDFVVFFSSVSSIFGNSDQCNYASGNAFLDTYAFWLQNKTKQPVKVINLTAIEDVGILAEDYKKKQMTKLRGMFGGLTCPIFLDHYQKIIESPSSQIQWIYGNFNWKLMVENFPSLSSRVDHLIDYRLQHNDDNNVTEVSLEGLCLTIARVFGLDEKNQFDTTAPLTQFGLDSLLAVELSNILKKKYNVKLSQMELLGGMTVEKIYGLTTKSQ